MIESMKLEGKTLSAWKGKSQEEILNDIIKFAEAVNAPQKSQDEYKPYWSAVRIEALAEVERLKNCRENLIKFYNGFTGPVYFIGYVDTPRGKADRWYIPLTRRILEIVSDLGADINIHLLPEVHEHKIDCLFLNNKE